MNITHLQNLQHNLKKNQQHGMIFSQTLNGLSILLIFLKNKQHLFTINPQFLYQNPYVLYYQVII